VGAQAIDRERDLAVDVVPDSKMHQSRLQQQARIADAGYAGERPAMATLINVEIVRQPPDQVGFAVHPKRWVVERFFAWINRNRRLWEDPETTLASAQAFLYAASVMILLRRLAPS